MKPLRAICAAMLVSAALAAGLSASLPAAASSAAATQQLRATVAGSALGWSSCGRLRKCAVGPPPLHVRQTKLELTLSH